MKTPESELEHLRDLIQGMEDGEFPETGVAYAFARNIVQHHDKDLLMIAPPKLVAAVHAIAEYFKETDKFGYITNFGEADHTELARQLAVVLDESGT